MFVGRIISNMTSRMVEYISRDSPYISGEKYGNEYSLDKAYTLQSLKAKIRSCEVDSDRIIQSHERLARA